MSHIIYQATLINRNIIMLQKMISRQLDDFMHSGGFTEGFTKERVASQTQQSQKEGAPSYPLCGKPMIMRTIKRGTKASRHFWACFDYSESQGTRDT